MKQIPPVITIDGPSGTGKGTLALRLSLILKWHFLDSGSLYRVLAYEALQREVDIADETSLVALTAELNLRFYYDPSIDKVHVILDEQDITNAIRTEAIGNAASKAGALPGVRQALLDKQRAFRQWPGLVTDGRDMGTVIFPDATLKIFLNASIEERANRRYKQLKEKEIHARLRDVENDLYERDLRDRERSISPLRPAADAIVIDTTDMGLDEVFNHVMSEVKKVL